MSLISTLPLVPLPRQAPRREIVVGSKVRAGLSPISIQRLQALHDHGVVALSIARENDSYRLIGRAGPYSWTVSSSGSRRWIEEDLRDAKEFLAALAAGEELEVR